MQKQVFQTDKEAVCPANESRAGEIAEARIITSAESQQGRQKDSAAQHKPPIQQWAAQMDSLFPVYPPSFIQS